MPSGRAAAQAAWPSVCGRSHPKPLHAWIHMQSLHVFGVAPCIRHHRRTTSLAAQKMYFSFVAGLNTHVKPYKHTVSRPCAGSGVDAGPERGGPGGRGRVQLRRTGGRQPGCHPVRARHRRPVRRAAAGVVCAGAHQVAGRHHRQGTPGLHPTGDCMLSYCADDAACSALIPWAGHLLPDTCMQSIAFRVCPCSNPQRRSPGMQVGRQHMGWLLYRVCSVAYCRLSWIEEPCAARLGETMLSVEEEVTLSPSMAVTSEF